MNVAGCASASLVPNSEVFGVHLIFPRGPYWDESKWNLPHSGQSLWCPGSLVTSGNEPHHRSGCTFWRHFISDSLVFFPLHDCVLSNQIPFTGWKEDDSMIFTRQAIEIGNIQVTSMSLGPSQGSIGYFFTCCVTSYWHSLKKEIMVINVSSLMGHRFASETDLSRDQGMLVLNLGSHPMEWCCSHLWWVSPP